MCESHGVKLWLRVRKSNPVMTVAYETQPPPWEPAIENSRFYQPRPEPVVYPLIEGDMIRILLNGFPHLRKIKTLMCYYTK